MAEPRAAAQKTDKEAPAKQNSKKYAGKASTMLAEAVAAAVPAASHMEPRAAQKAVRLNAKTKAEVAERNQNQLSKWHGGGQHGRPHTKPQLQLAQGRTH